jgi:hypothetical protein
MYDVQCWVYEMTLVFNIVHNCKTLRFKIVLSRQMLKFALSQKIIH